MYFQRVSLFNKLFGRTGSLMNDNGLEEALEVVFAENMF